MRIKQNTDHVFLFGPFLDPTDFVSPVSTLASALDNANTGIRIFKEGANASALRHTPVANSVYDASNIGWYKVTLNASDTDTIGTLQVFWHNQSLTSTPAFEDFEIVAANPFDALGAGTDYLQVDQVQIAGDGNASTALRESLLTTVEGLVGNGSTTTTIVANSTTPATVKADQWKGKQLSFSRYTTTANLRSESTLINGNTANGQIQVVALTDAPVNGDIFKIT